MLSNFFASSQNRVKSKKLSVQQYVEQPKHIQYSMDSVSKIELKNKIQQLFTAISNEVVLDSFLYRRNLELSKVSLAKLSRYEANKNSFQLENNDKQLINCYPIGEDKYSITISYINRLKTIEKKQLIYIISLIANKTRKGFKFSIPLEYLTRYWKTKIIGNIKYVFRGKIRQEQAEVFNKKNKEIARKLGVKPEKLTVYMCDDYQEIQKLIGLEYDIFTNGFYRDGYGVIANTIFSVMNNEDFSHDMLHYYSGKKYKKETRNWVAEEGVAYVWGNAYYTDKKGNVISFKHLKQSLKEYLQQHKKANLFEMFRKDTKIFNHIAYEVSVRSVIAGILVNQVELEKGNQGVLTLITSGRKDNLQSFLNAINSLIGINSSNFNQEVSKLVWKDNQYSKKEMR